MLFTQIALAAATFVAGSFAAADEFYIKTTGSSLSSHNDLFLEAYHTGAGLADAVLSTDNINAGHFYLNDTELRMDVGDVDYAYGFELAADSGYAAWQFVTINVQTAQSGFSVESNGTVAFNGTEFGGWLACDWWHGAPQLFWKIEFDSVDIPSSCSSVTLVTQAISS
ncbi:hypothetical protein UA08_02454 [Talaromyces atroroseus]|uniref:DUF7907 domain-containing protein n=1 Tax=Talaromyces atroroseus TaxID=1441469 RepID=A0A225B2J9_TALAT|nr:hypothetical protein UA08_02454 [Talaromyces atroroseus]OKL62209.1 hypothetical protein UA08_02454 [Talaromyces atroroseus]